MLARLGVVGWIVEQVIWSWVTLAALVTPELLSLSFMLGRVNLVETIKGTNGCLVWLL